MKLKLLGANIVTVVGWLGRVDVIPARLPASLD